MAKSRAEAVEQDLLVVYSVSDIGGLSGHIQMSSLVLGWHCGILGGLLDTAKSDQNNPLVWQLYELNGQQ